MEENVKMNILSNHLSRRMLNTHEELGAAQGAKVEDQYPQELMINNFNREQTVKMIWHGIKDMQAGRGRGQLREEIPARLIQNGRRGLERG